MLPHSHFTLTDKGARYTGLLMADCHAPLVCLSLWQAQSEYNNQDGRAGAEPVEWTPSMGGGVDKASREGSGQKISKSISLLQHSAHNTTSGLRAILQSGRGSIAI